MNLNITKQQIKKNIPTPETLTKSLFFYSPNHQINSRKKIISTAVGCLLFKI